MPFTSFSDLRTELRARTGNRSSADLSDTRIDIALQHSVRQLASPDVHRHAEMELIVRINTVDGTDVYTLDDDIWTIYAVRDETVTNVRRLAPMGIQFMLELLKSRGQPLRYARWGRDLHLDPIPNGVFTIDVYHYAYPQFSLTPTGTGGEALPLSGNCPLFDIYDEGVLLGAESRIWFNVLQNPQRGQMVKDQLSDWMSTIISPAQGDLDDQEDVLQPDLDGLLGTGR